MLPALVTTDGLTRIHSNAAMPESRYCPVAVRSTAVMPLSFQWASLVGSGSGRLEYSIVRV